MQLPLLFVARIYVCTFCYIIAHIVPTVTSVSSVFLIIDDYTLVLYTVNCASYSKQYDIVVVSAVC